MQYGQNNWQPYTMPRNDYQYNNNYNQQSNNGLIWVQGEAGAKSYLLAPNTTVMLMDSEESKFYLKSSDASGMPQPLRVFEYKELTAGTPQNNTEEQQVESSMLETIQQQYNEIIQRLDSVAPKKKKTTKKDEEVDNG